MVIKSFLDNAVVRVEMRIPWFGGLLIVLVVALPGGATAQMRADYIGQADSLCTREPTASREIELIVGPTGSKTQNQTLLHRIARALRPVTRAYGRLTRELSQIVAAPGDEVLTARWMAARLAVFRDRKRAIKAAHAGHFGKFISRIRHEQKATHEAAAAMDAFGPPSPFKVCTP